MNFLVSWTKIGPAPTLQRDRFQDLLDYIGLAEFFAAIVGMKSRLPPARSSLRTFLPRRGSLRTTRDGHALRIRDFWPEDAPALALKNSMAISTSPHTPACAINRRC